MFYFVQDRRNDEQGQETTEKCHKEMDQVYLGKLGKGDLEPEWSFKSVNINQKGGVLFRSEGILAVVKLGPEVVTRVFLDDDRLSVPLGFFFSLLYSSKQPLNNSL